MSDQENATETTKTPAETSATEPQKELIMPKTKLSDRFSMRLRLQLILGDRIMKVRDIRDALEERSWQTGHENAIYTVLNTSKTTFDSLGGGYYRVNADANPVPEGILAAYPVGEVSITRSFQGEPATALVRKVSKKSAAKKINKALVRKAAKKSAAKVEANTERKAVQCSICVAEGKSGRGHNKRGHEAFLTRKTQQTTKSPKALLPASNGHGWQATARKAGWLPPAERKVQMNVTFAPGTDAEAMEKAILQVIGAAKKGVTGPVLALNLD